MGGEIVCRPKNTHMCGSGVPLHTLWDLVVCPSACPHCALCIALAQGLVLHAAVSWTPFLHALPPAVVLWLASRCVASDAPDESLRTDDARADPADATTEDHEATRLAAFPPDDLRRLWGVASQRLWELRHPAHIAVRACCAGRWARLPVARRCCVSWCAFMCTRLEDRYVRPLRLYVDAWHS